MSERPTAVEIHPLTPDRWADLEALFGPNGAVAGCWCMWWRQTSAEFEAQHGEPNRQAFRAIVEWGAKPGLLAYVDGRPAGWCAVAPRAEYGRIERSRNFRPVDAEPAWAITCFYIDRRHRRTGLGEALLQAAVAHTTAHGAQLVEGYPVDPGAGRVANASAFTGVVAMFRNAGFAEVARRAPGRPIMRWSALQ